MRRSILIASLALLLASPAFAAPCKHATNQNRNAATGRYEHANRTAVGFHSTAAPLGVRAHLMGNVGIDLGLGFSSQDNLDTWTFDGGLPITIVKRGWLSALLRPGATYDKCETLLGDRKTTTLSAEVEGEAFLVKDFSVSAAFGVAHETGTDEWHSTGGEFTRVGMHLYLFR